MNGIKEKRTLWTDPNRPCVTDREDYSDTSYLTKGRGGGINLLEPMAQACLFRCPQYRACWQEMHKHLMAGEQYRNTVIAGIVYDASGAVRDI